MKLHFFRCCVQSVVLPTFFFTFKPDPQISSKLKLEDFWNLETIRIKEPFRETDDDLALQRLMKV